MTRQIRILWRAIAAFATVSVVLEVLGVSGFSFVWKYIWTRNFTLVSSLYFAVTVIIAVFGLVTLFALIGTRGKLQEDIAVGGSTTPLNWRRKRQVMVSWGSF